MWRRGADMDGNVANFVESEQILETKGYLASYTQVHVNFCMHFHVYDCKRFNV